MYRTYRGTVVTTIVHSFVTEANSPEEAEVIFDSWAEEKEIGDEESRVSEVEDVEEVEVGDMGDVQLAADDE